MFPSYFPNSWQAFSLQATSEPAFDRRGDLQFLPIRGIRVINCSTKKFGCLEIFPELRLGFSELNSE
jgi:hypothetical protein